MIESVALLATLMLGLYAGSLLTEAMILVPYWRRMDPNEFLNLHASLGPNLFRFFAPLTTIAVLLTVVVALISQGENTPWLIASILSLTALVIFFIYFRTANNRFATHTIAAAELGPELKRWASWHWLRTIAVILALGMSIYGHRL